MDSYSDMKCWEIINCAKLDCLASSEPKTPCWKIAIKTVSYQEVPNTCSDCIVYLIHKETSVLSKKEIQEILKHRGKYDNIGTGYIDCILKTSSSD
jgi:hypothetical protein